MGLDTISTPKDEILFAKAETNFGTPAYPVGTDFIPLISAATFEQKRVFVDDPQKQMTVSQLAKLGTGYDAGGLNFSMMIKPSGALGTPCRGSQIFKGVFGKQTTTPATSDAFSLNGIYDDLVSFTMVHRKGHMVTYNFGCLIDKGVFPVKADNSEGALGQAQFSGAFSRQAKAGYSYVNYPAGYIAGATQIIIDDAQFDPDAKIQFRDATTGVVIDDNAGAGFTISSVNTMTKTLTLETGLINAVADNSIVDGFVPTASDAGTVAYGRLGKAQECAVGGSLADLTIIDAQIEITNNFKIKVDEKTGILYPNSATRNTRVVNYTCNQVFYKGGAQYYFESAAQTQKHISLPVGDTAGYRYRFDLPYVQFETPSLADGDEISIGRTGTAIASAAYNDEITMIFD